MASALERHYYPNAVLIIVEFPISDRVYPEPTEMAYILHLPCEGGAVKSLTTSRFGSLHHPITLEFCRNVFETDIKARGNTSGKTCTPLQVIFLLKKIHESEIRLHERFDMNINSGYMCRDDPIGR